MIFGTISDKDANQQVIDQIPGLNIHYNFLNKEEESYLIDIIDSLNWIDNLSHRSQYYGFEYKYNKKFVSYKDYKGELPSTLNFIKDKLNMDYNQLVIDEYKNNEGMRSHTESDIYDSNIILCPLGSDCIMTFEGDGIKHTILLKRRSLIVMGAESRYRFKHGIPFNKTDKFNNRKIKRDGRRLLMTFRNVKLL
ncbi:MAG: putative oxidoreductase [uncultured marine phage]|uniref:Putative oxidoreductase n=1 Tax=uncultured marine phage TaxID=707152 RepID=A0A8D9CDV8_9VIRU|nr:MAG: putative oxidoreductase [uncultured marine phage]